MGQCVDVTGVKLRGINKRGKHSSSQKDSPRLDRSDLFIVICQVIWTVV